MPDPASPPRWLAWAGAISPLGVIAGALIASGSYISDVRDNERRITALESKMELVQTIDVRTARIEGRIELLVSRERQR